MPDEPSLPYRNIDTPTDYAGDEACTACHEDAVSVYQTHAMARTFHPWTAETRVEAALDEPVFNEPSGFYYAIVEHDGQLYQEEFLIGPDGRRLHELQRRMDYVMGSGNVARTYFTEENGRLFQLPLTWYSQRGWDFSPGYEINNARFDRLLPDRCIACHGSYPEPFPHLEGKYANLPPGIGCERCHGPGALHVSERTKGSDLQPALAWIRADYARFLHARGQREEAEDAYRTALAERPSLDVATFNLGTLLAGQGRLTEATEAFQNAVRLNPSIAEGLAPLLHVRADRNKVAAVRELGSLLETLPQRGRGPNAVQFTTGPQAQRGVLFVNVPPGATVRVLEPDGALVRALSGAEGPFVVWDLLTQSGNAIAGGLYRVEVLGQDGSGRLARQQFWFGVVRVGSP